MTPKCKEIILPPTVIVLIVFIKTAVYLKKMFTFNKTELILTQSKTEVLVIKITSTKHNVERVITSKYWLTTFVVSHN